MEKILAQAEKKTISALKKELVKRRDGCIGLSDPRLGRYMKHFYLKELWKIFFQNFTKRYEEEGRDFTCVDSVISAFSHLDPAKCMVRNLRAWVEVKLAHHTFRILEAEGVFYVVAESMDAFPITMHAASLVAAVTAYDDYTDQMDFNALLDQTLLDIAAEDKCQQMLTMTARALVEDILKGEDVRFEVSQQKNGRLCCTIHRWASWFPDKVFRTSFETFREDFIKAYEDFKSRNSSFWCL